jgi:hypothetical protein
MNTYNRHRFPPDRMALLLRGSSSDYCETMIAGALRSMGYSDHYVFEVESWVLAH